MTPPDALEGRSSENVDAEMGDAQGATQENRTRGPATDRRSAMEIQCDQSGMPATRAADGEAGLTYISRENPTGMSDNSGLELSSTSQGLRFLPPAPQNQARSIGPPLSQRVTPAQDGLPSSSLALSDQASQRGTPVQRKRGYEPDSQLSTTPQERGTTSVQDAERFIEEVDAYGVRTKVRVTSNEAEVRQRIQERDEVAAERDSVAAERTLWKKKVEEMEQNLQSITTDKDRLQQDLNRTTLHLTQANRKVTYLESHVERIKLEARSQIDNLRSRMSIETARHAKLMEEWEAQRAVQEREAEGHYQAVQAQLATLQNELRHATSQMQQWRGQYAAQARQNEMHEQRIAAQTNVMPGAFQVQGPPPVHPDHLDSHMAELPADQPFSRPFRAEPPTDPQPSGPAIINMPRPVPRVVVPPIQQSTTDPQQPSRPSSAALSYRSSSVGPPGSYSETAQSAPPPAPIIHQPTASHPPRIFTNTPSERQPITYPALFPSQTNEPRPNTPHTTINLPQNVPTTSQQNNGRAVHFHPPQTYSQSEDISMREPVDAANDANAEESDGAELPTMVDVRTVKPKRKKRTAVKGPILQRLAHRQVEIIAPPAGYSRSRLSNPLSSKLRLPDSTPASNGASTPYPSTQIDAPRNMMKGFSPPQFIPRTQQSGTTPNLRSSRQSTLQSQSRGRSPPIDPPGSIFGRHNMPPFEARGPTGPLLPEPSNVRPSRGPTPQTSHHPHTTSRTASASGKTAQREPTPEVHSRGGNNIRGDNVESEVAAGLIASMRALADQISALPHELAAQMSAIREEPRRQEPPYTPPRKGNTHFPFRSPAKLKPRTPMRQEFLNLARPELNRLLHLSEDNDIVHTVARHIVPMHVLEDYEAGVGDPPTLDPLLITWDHPTSQWNLELAERFQEHFVEKNPIFAGREEEIQKYFIQRIQTLQKILNDRVVREDEDIQAATERVAAKLEQEERAKRRRSRQRKRLNDRLEICRLMAQQDSTFEAMYDVIDRLNIDGMSSDDTDGERYSVRILPWRPPELVDVMDYLDSLPDRLTMYGNRRPGGLPHPRDRRVTQAESEREAPATLPRNLYSRSWFLGLSQFQLSRLAPSEDITILFVDRLN